MRTRKSTILSYVDAPWRERTAGRLIRAAGTLTGPLPFLLRVFLGHAFGVRRVASVCLILGGLLILRGENRLSW